MPNRPLPGAYFSEEVNTSMISTASNARVSCIIGPTRDYKYFVGSLVRGNKPVIPLAAIGSIYKQDVTSIVGSLLPSIAIGDTLKQFSTINFTQLYSYSSLGETLVTEINDKLLVSGLNYIKLEADGSYTLLSDTAQAGYKKIVAGTASTGEVSIPEILASVYSEDFTLLLNSLSALNMVGDPLFVTIANNKVSLADSTTAGAICVADTEKVYFKIATGDLTVIDNPTINTLKDYLVAPDGITNLKKQDLKNLTILVGSSSGYWNYREGTDFTLNTATINPEDDIVISWNSSVGANVPVSGSSYWIKYMYKKVQSDYEPKLHFSLPSIEADHGPEFSSGVLSPLTIAANLLLEGQTTNGGGVYIIPTTNDSLLAYKKALKLAENIRVDTILTISQSLDVRIATLEHITKMSDMFIGKPRTTIFTNIDLDLPTVKDQIIALNSNRATLFGNSFVSIYLEDSASKEGSWYTLPAIYAICNLSGIENLPNNLRAEPMLNKVLSTRIRIPTALAIPQEAKNFCENSLISMLEMDPASYMVKVLDIFTTNALNVREETRAATLVNDLITVTLNEGCTKRFVGKIGVELPLSVKKYIEAVLESFIITGEIVAYKPVNVTVDPNDPRLFEAPFEVKNSYELKWIKGKFKSYI